MSEPSTEIKKKAGAQTYWKPDELLLLLGELPGYIKLEKFTNKTAYVRSCCNALFAKFPPRHFAQREEDFPAEADGGEALEDFQRRQKAFVDKIMTIVQDASVWSS